MNYPQRGIGQTSIDRMHDFARRLDISLFETMGRIFEVIEIKERIQKNIKIFKLFLNKYVDLKDELSINELTRALVDELNILKILKGEGTEENNIAYKNIEKLLDIIAVMNKNNKKLNIVEFLEFISLFENQDEYNEKDNVVNLMTMHEAQIFCV